MYVKNEIDMDIVEVFTDDLIDIVSALTNNMIDLKNERLQIGFLLARFSVSVVYGALDNVPDVNKNEYLPTLIILCKERFKEIHGV